MHKSGLDTYQSNTIRVRGILLSVLAAFILLLGSTVFVRLLCVYSHRPSDFAQDYWAAQALCDDKSPYDVWIVDKWGYSVPVVNNHPPFVAFLFIPLTFLSYEAAFFLWGIFSLVLYLGVLGGVLCELKIHLDVWQSVLVTGIALCWYPFLAHIALGQLSILLTGCIFLGWCCLRRGWDWLAGVLLGVASALKLFPALLVLYLILHRRWKALSGFIVSTFCCFVLPLSVMSPEDYWRYFVDVTPRNFAGCVLFPANISIAGAINRLLVNGPWVQGLVNRPELVEPFTIVFNLVVLIVLLNRILHLPKNHFGSDFVFSYSSIAMILISPISWQHAFPLLLLPFGLLFKGLQGRRPRKLYDLFLFSLLLLSLPYFQIGDLLMTLCAPGQMPWYIALLLLMPIVGMCLLWWLLDQGMRGVIRV